MYEAETWSLTKRSLNKPKEEIQGNLNDAYRQGAL